MSSDLELWGGVECTVNRVGNDYIDQLDMSGHEERISDLKLFQQIGVKTLRFPVLWERFVNGLPASLATPSGDSGISWGFLDQRLAYVRELGIKVIVGFVHHGSGPPYTSLLDPEFPAKLAHFAHLFARRYPWIDAYTPINEPLTTARFSGLYGVWYPHGRSDKDFLNILFNECRAVTAVMAQVRAVNPAARLVQTEDMGKVFSTHFLSYQAKFENHRRWLTFDFLLGRLRPGHPLWSYCLKHGLTAKQLMDFAEDPCPPQVIGINHYITSNRFLDERLERYPAVLHGGNGRHRYADIEAVRVGAENLAGPREILQEVWERYHIPLAVTEVHIGCTRDEQLRWFYEIWHAAASLRREGLDIRAVTAWSLLGAFGWDSLVTVAHGRYEPGVFDLRAPTPRPTAIAEMLKGLSQHRQYDHPVLDVPGWWHRQNRLLYPSVQLKIQAKGLGLEVEPLIAQALFWNGKKPRQILITGGKGTLATAFQFICDRRGLPFWAVCKSELDVTNETAVRQMISALEPWAVINGAGFSGVDLAETAADECYRSNVLGSKVLASVCAEQKIRLLTFSSDLVFDGHQGFPYEEHHSTCPLNLYGRSQVEAECEVMDLNEETLVIRTSAFFGPWDEVNFLTMTLRQLAQGQTVKIPEQQTISPTYLPDLVDASLDLLIDGEKGIWHLTNLGALSWVEFARWGAERFGLSKNLILSATSAEMGWVAERPRNSALTSARGKLLPELGQAISRFQQDCRVALL